MSISVNLLFPVSRKTRRYCKISCLFFLFFALVFYIELKVGSYSEEALIRASSHIRKTHSKNTDDPEEIDLRGYRHPNSIDHNSFDKRAKGEYKNSKSLVQKLKPKLKKQSTSSLASGEVDDELWAGDLGVAKNEQEVKLREDGYKTFAFNTLVSSRLGLNRTLPDTRHKECKKLSYSTDLPTASIIICYYHEDLVVLLRTIHSIVERTPLNILNEILVINDHSDIDISKNITKHLGIRFMQK